MNKLCKRLFAILLGAFLAVSLFGCGSSGSNGNTTPTNEDWTYSPQGATAVDGTWADPVSGRPADPWSVTPEVNTKATSRFNLYNGGYAAAAGDWILYNNPDDNGYLYRMNIHNKETALLCAVPNVSYIAVNGEMAYFSSRSDFGTGHAIYAYNMGTGAQTQLLNGSGGYLQYYGGYLYYTQSQNWGGAATLFRIPAQGGEAEEIYNETPVKWFVIHPDEQKIYFYYNLGYATTMYMDGTGVTRGIETGITPDWEFYDWKDDIALTDESIELTKGFSSDIAFALDTYPNHLKAVNVINEQVCFATDKAVYVVPMSKYETGGGIGMDDDPLESNRLFLSSAASRICIVSGWVFCYSTDTSFNPSALKMEYVPALRGQ